MYCLEHRSYAGHECRHAHAKQQLAIRCPICAATLQLRGDEDPNAVWERHQASDGCDAAKRKKKRQRCPATNCREVLGPTNTCLCQLCGKSYCLRHRFKSDHACEGRPARGVAGWFSNSTAGPPAPASLPARRHPASASSARPAAAAASAASASAAVRPPDESNTLRGSTDRRRRGGGGYPGQQYRQGGQNQVIDLTTDSPPRRPEGQQQQQLQLPGVTVDGGCPFCGVVLEDPVALVAHVEAKHPNGAAQPETSSSCRVG